MTDPAAVLAEMEQWLVDLEGSKARMFYRKDAERWREALSQQTARVEALRRFVVPSMTDYAIGLLVAALPAQPEMKEKHE